MIIFVVLVELDIVEDLSELGLGGVEEFVGVELRGVKMFGKGDEIEFIVCYAGLARPQFYERYCLFGLRPYYFIEKDYEIIRFHFVIFNTVL